MGKYQLTHEQMLRYEEEQIALAATSSHANRRSIAAMSRSPYCARQPRRRHRGACPRISSAWQRDRRVSHDVSRRRGVTSPRYERIDGRPNIVRGGSHSGNVAAHQLAASNLLDILSSDYYPASLLDAAFRIADDHDNAFSLPQAISSGQQNPAQALGLDDRG